jgi:hypothetical protein
MLKLCKFQTMLNPDPKKGMLTLATADPGRRALDPEVLINFPRWISYWSACLEEASDAGRVLVESDAGVSVAANDAEAVADG